MPGHEALIGELKFDGKTTGPEAAVRVLNAERGKTAKLAEDRSADAPKVVPTDARGTDEPVVAKEPDAKALAKRAGELVADAESKGLTLSYATAVQQAMKEHANG